ncbi:MAG: hypothetical protein RRB13_15300 [bacterium]|nr:hypothetical protein [bacterium]
MLDCKVPKDSANPYELEQGQKVEVCYKKILNHLVWVRPAVSHGYENS